MKNNTKMLEVGWFRNFFILFTGFYTYVIAKSFLMSTQTDLVIFAVKHTSFRMFGINPLFNISDAASFIYNTHGETIPLLISLITVMGLLSYKNEIPINKKLKVVWFGMVPFIVFVVLSLFIH